MKTLLFLEPFVQITLFCLKLFFLLQTLHLPFFPLIRPKLPTLSSSFSVQAPFFDLPPFVCHTVAIVGFVVVSRAKPHSPFSLIDSRCDEIMLKTVRLFTLMLPFAFAPSCVLGVVSLKISCGDCYASFSFCQPPLVTSSRYLHRHCQRRFETLIPLLHKL